MSIIVHWFLECRRSLLPSLVWPLPICLDSWTWHSRFLCNIALYSIGPSITSNIHSWVLFLLWFHPFILSGVISPLISSSIFERLLTWGVHLSVSYLFAFSYCSWGSQGKNSEWFASPFSSGPHSVWPLHHDLPVLGGPSWHGLVSLS